MTLAEPCAAQCFQAESLHNMALRSISAMTSKQRLKRPVTIQIVCACDEAFVPHVAAMLCSVLEHNEAVSVHLLYARIPDETVSSLRRFVESRGAEFHGHLFDDGILLSLPVAHLSVETHYRVLAPELLPETVKRFIYLDADAIVRTSLAPLWSTDLEGHALAATPSPHPHMHKHDIVPEGAEYFNAGVLLVDADKWRRENIGRKIIEYAENNRGRMRFCNQDSMNAILHDDFKPISQYWNFQPCYPLSVWSLSSEELRNPGIVHFNGPIKPSHYRSKGFFKQEYVRYRKRTPWGRYRPEGAPPPIKHLYHRARQPIREYFRRFKTA